MIFFLWCLVDIYPLSQLIKRHRLATSTIKLFDMFQAACSFKLLSVEQEFYRTLNEEKGAKECKQGCKRWVEDDEMLPVWPKEEKYVTPKHTNCKTRSHPHWYEALVSHWYKRRYIKVAYGLLTACQSQKGHYTNTAFDRFSEQETTCQHGER